MLSDQRPRKDDGFTLVELIVTVAIVGFITVTLTGVVILYLKLSTTTQARLTESTDQQFASTYWQQDVSSLGVHGFTPAAAEQLPVQQSVRLGAAPAGTPAGCSGLPGTVIGLAWNDYPGSTDPIATWNATANAAVYVTEADGEQLKLSRVRCIGGTTKTNVIARKLDPASPPVARCLGSNGTTVVSCTSTSPLPATVQLVLTVRDLSAKSPSGPASAGYTTTLTAQRRQG